MSFICLSVPGTRDSSYRTRDSSSKTQFRTQFRTRFELRNARFELRNARFEDAKVGRVGSLVVLFVASARAMHQCMDEFNEQDLANMAWAFATAGGSDELLFAALARAVRRRLGEFKV